MLEMINAPGFWAAVLQIILIDVVLSGDNAVVIALACRNLPPQQRRLGILWGVSGAVTLRILLTFFAVGLLGFPGLKIAGGFLLLWIGIQLLLPDDDEQEITPADHLFGAVRTIILADLVMSLDNVVGVAAAAKDNVYLLIFGLAVSIPLIVGSSQLIMSLMGRFPWIVLGGAGLLGWVAGEMLVADTLWKAWLTATAPWANHLIPALGALLVISVGSWLARRSLVAARAGRSASEGAD
ncbi:TerC family protein [Rhodocyclus tenuis]|uniref:TerC family protein n=2 Tax=Rhodocyclus TaxID=1064 RepID=A0ABX0WJB6_9RHOO|nr:TerC family protein [Rhodocyclus gracilis]MQY51751.1 YjbE family putative metal transport protein [Rhodocyclus gracilis]MRD73231.1 YjbE family putative metal transport protein [Rhodocyclus gracilis]NJA88988.1 TerC family protein [Rhodocyclus gracilis]